ncbi:MAG: HNH endonuclease signature motif containing protein [Cyanobacteria bacterium J06559_3]
MSSYIPVSLQQQIKKHFANCCAYCRTAESLTVSTFEFEHIVPLSRRGKTAFSNLCLSCPTSRAG